MGTDMTNNGVPMKRIVPTYLALMAHLSHLLSVLGYDELVVVRRRGGRRENLFSAGGKGLIDLGARVDLDARELGKSNGRDCGDLVRSHLHI